MGVKQMIIDIDAGQFDGIVREWLHHTLMTLEGNLVEIKKSGHPDDVKQYKKDIKALKQVLDYVGHI
jgi:hypothetical protein